MNSGNQITTWKNLIIAQAAIRPAEIEMAVDHFK